MVSNSDRPDAAAVSYACWKDARFRWVAFALVALKLYLVAGQPIFAITPADMDDGLSVKLADSILRGEWLGNYDDKTLVKGAGYSLFIALTVVLGIPLPIAQHLLYALATWLLVRAVRTHLSGDAWALALFALVLWNPVTFEVGTMGRVLRHQLVAPLGMLAFAGLFALGTRVAARMWARSVWAVTLGFSLGALWITREETFWIVPSVALLGIVAVLFARRDGAGWIRTVWPLPIAAAAAIAPVVTVSAVNYRHYGWFGTVEVRAPEFVATIGALQRITPPDGRIPLVPINRSVRELAYDASPAFRELKPHLEGVIGQRASAASSLFAGLPAESMEIVDGWTYLAIREATRAAGRADDAGEAVAFYGQVAQELDDACKSGALPAGRRYHSLRPIWQPVYTGKTMREFLPFVSAFATGRWSNFTPPDSVGDANGLRAFRDVTQWHTTPVQDRPEFNMNRTIEWAAPRVRMLRSLGPLLSIAGAMIMAAGVLAWFVRAATDAWKRRWPSYVWWAATGTWGGAAAVVAVALFMHVTSFPISNPGYYSAAYPLAYLAAGLSLAALLTRRASEAVY